MRELSYQISDPNFTIYHRAAVGGLAATVRSWPRPPHGIQAHVDRQGVTLTFAADITDRAAVEGLLAASFPKTRDGLIHLPGHQLPRDRDDLRAVIHNALCQTFLQHPKMRPGTAQPRQVVMQSVDDDQPTTRISYKDVSTYAHQRAQGTGILEHKSAAGELAPVATIPQSIMPGATGGACSLDASGKEVLLLLYLMVGCQVFQLMPRRKDDGPRACVVVPDVSDPQTYAEVLGTLMARTSRLVPLERACHVAHPLGRTLGGGEDAGLRFLFDFQQASIAAEVEDCVRGCQVIAMGKVAWDKNQINRSLSLRLDPVERYRDHDIYLAARQYLGRGKSIPRKDGETFIAPESPVPALVAANLARGRPWCMGFAELAATRRDFSQLGYSRMGLIRMKDAISDEDDKAVIEAFRGAWRSRMGRLAERAKKDGLDFQRLCEVDRERLRNDFLRAKTSDELTGRFLRLCTDASEGKSLRELREQNERLRKFLFNPHNLERFRNLLFFAMLTYEGKGELASTTENTSEGN